MPLLAPPPPLRSSPSPAPPTLRVPVPKGVTHPVYLRADGSPTVGTGSGDFAFGVMPSLPERRFAGWINFPNVKAPMVCVHHLETRSVSVSLPASAGADALVCTWEGAGGMEAENRPPRSATLEGDFSPKSTAAFPYRLSHPRHLFGRTDYTQQVRFCPRLGPDEEEPEPVFILFDFPGSYLDTPCCPEDCPCGGSCTSGCTCCPCHELCPEHGIPYAECAHLHEEDGYGEASLLPRLAGVLPLRTPTLYADAVPVPVPVPAEGYTPCCPCPGHGAPHADAAYVSPRLSVLTPDGAAFGTVTEPTVALVGGSFPSEAVGDARLMFATNGATCLDLRYTVFGVGVSGVGPVDLAMLNALNPDFGLPVAVGTNAPSENLKLDLKVRLPSGRVRLSFANATGGGAFRLLRRDPGGGGWRTLMDSAAQPVLDMSVAQWRWIFRSDAGAAFSAPVAVVASSAGTCDVVFRYWLGGGAFAEDVAVQRITAVDPPLMADITRDGSIDAADVAAYVAGRPFRYWINEDTAKGDYVGQDPDLSLNAADHVVNGRLDLVNLFPVKLDLKPFIDAWGSAARFQIYAPNGTLNFCGVDVAPEEAGTIQTNDVYTTGATAGVPLYAAELTEALYEGVDIEPSDYLGNGNEPGVLAFEAVETYGKPKLSVLLGETSVLEFELPLSLSSVKDMYRWYNARHFSGQGKARASMMEAPINNPDGLENAKTLIFLHGANVSEADAEKWGDALFKRLWHMGCRVNFVNVDWRSDIGSDANYHQNASNAFVVASQIADDIKAIPGVKVMMAHSLGNMVVSSMIQDHGLQVSKYIMCNSSVPAEAYDTTLSPTNVLVHKDWNEYPRKSFANEWYRLFEDDVGDDRRLLTWRGRFPSVGPLAVNFFSSKDHVLEFFPTNTIGAMDGYENWNQMFEHYSWHKQELWKGRKGTLARIGTTGWSGWSIRENILGYNAIQPTNAWLMSDAELKTNTVFKLQPESMNTNVISRLVRDMHLTQGIPARTPASGFTSWGDVDNPMFNVNETNPQRRGIERPNGWPVRTLGWLLTTTWTTEWLHSDMKDISYFFMYKFFEKVIDEGELK